MKKLVFTGLLCLTLVLGGCRNEANAEKEKISSIEFEVERVDVNINEDFIVRVIAKSDEGKKNETIKYKSINEGYIEIREPTNDGFIVRGIKAGSTVIRAQSKTVDVMLEVKVYGEDVLARYIKLEKPVIEVNEGMQVTTSVSLFGRVTEPDDNSLFEYELEEGKTNIAYNYTNNILVIRGIERGYQEIKVSHPRASFDNKILIFVKGVDEEIKYIYRESNIMMVPNDGQYHDFDVVLINGKPADVIDFKYDVIAGNDNIEEISWANDKCNVLAKRTGFATIRVHHPLAEVDFDVRIIIYDEAVPYILLEQTFLLLNIMQSERFGAEVVNARNGVLYKDQFSYKIIENSEEVSDEESIIEVIQTSESFYVRAKRSGTARIVISNEQVQTPREVLVVVREEAAYRDDYYITTEQNVITTQVGADMTRLYVRLVNGVSADANNFIWDLDDNTVISLHTNHGSVRSASRAMVQQVFEAYADIEPKKPGTAKITITNTKFKDTLAQVIVRVYPKGTFAEPPVRVGYDGLIKIEYGHPETISLRVTEGDESKVGSLDWETEDSEVAVFNYGNAHGMVNVMSAVKSTGGGITKMIVSGDKLEFPHESIVLAGDRDYIDNTSIIYVDNIYQKVVEQQTINVHVLNSKTDENWQPFGFSAKVVNPNVVYAVMVKNVLKIMGKERGETNIIVSHGEAANESITLHIRVEAANISIEQPYYLSGTEIKGVVMGIPTEISVSMPGAPESEWNKLVWTSRDPTVVTASGAGLSGLLTGKISGKQAFVSVAHKNNKAEEKRILVYVVETENELKNVILGARQENYLLKTGQEQLVTIITNATDEQKKNISWKVVTKPGESAPVTIDPHYDSAMVRAVTAGNAVLEVTYTDKDDDDNVTGKYTLPLSIYVSVVDTLSDEKIIKGPAVIEIIRGESRIVAVQQLNLTQNEIMDIKWDVEVEANEEPLANIEGNGDSAYLYGLRKGVGKVKIWQDNLRYIHYATLVCANSAEELANMYVMGVDSSYQKMLLGEEKKVKLTFGSNGFPETAKQNLVWTADGSGKVKIAGKGESVSIIAQEPGEATVTVMDANNPQVSLNESLEMKFLVIDPNNSNLEFRGHQKMVGIVVGQSQSVNMRLYDNEEEIKNYHLWSHEIEKEEIIRVNRVDGDPSGQTLHIQADKVGESYVTVRYNNEVYARILVYTALTADDLENYYPILVEKTNYLLQIGQSDVVRIETMADKDEVNFSKISWGIEGANFIESVNTINKKEFTIKGKSAGQCVINVNYTDKGKTETKARIFVTVVSNEEIDTTKYIVTEGIIGMQTGSQVDTKIFHNLGSSVSNVVWESLQTSVVTVSGSGEEATLRAVSAGEAYVTVSYGSWLKRYIRVYVRPAGMDVGDYKAMNIENQYYRVGIGETLVLPVYFAPLKTIVPTMWLDKYENKVVQFKPLENGEKVDITALSEGVAVLEAVNTGINDTSHVLRIYVEVSKKYNNAPKPVVERFLTISKTLYMMNPDEKNEELNLRVQGIGYKAEELANVKWQLVDNSGKYISIYPNGQECRVRVNPAGEEGTAEIKVSNTDNEIIIRVIVSRTGMLGFPNIAGESTLRVGLNQKLSAAYEVVEAVSYNLDDFEVRIMSGSNIVNAKFNKNILEVEGKMSGQAVLRITCVPVVSAAHYKDVAVMVTTTTDGIVYLTTRDNFTQVKIGETKTVSVDLVGLNNPNESGYVWSIEEKDKKHLQLVSTGRQAQVKGLERGAGQTVKVTVTNTLIDEMFSLTMWVRISDNFFNAMYLTTTQNIVSVIEGRSMYLTAELVNGTPGEESLISWQCLDTGYARVMGTGTQAYVLGKRTGFARVRAAYNKAVNKYIEILVIVEKDTASNGIYITSTDGLVQMKPGDTRQLSVRLVGGSLGDEYGFNWEEHAQDPLLNDEKTNQVVKIIGSSSGLDKTIIMAMNEGEATIRVTHRRSSYILDLKIYVQKYNKIEFEVENITINEGEEKIVRVTMPPNTSVRYEVSKPNIVSLSDMGPTTSEFLVVTGVNPGICVITASSVDKVLTDEIIVTVNQVNNKLVQYIQTNDTIFNMIDWQSAANRVMVTGLPVGEKPGGGEFSEADSLRLEWNITSGNQFIEFDAAAGTKTRAIGKLASIASKKPGTAEIEVTHPEMAGYSKKVYVNVKPYDTDFLLSPTFQSMQIGEQANFSVRITSNLDKDEYEDEYAQLTWRLISNEEDKYGVEFTKVEAEDTKYEKTGTKGMVSVNVLAGEDGVYKLKVIYKGRELEAIILVEKAKVLEIYDESFIKMAPKSTVFIKLYHEPLKVGSDGGPKSVWFDYNNEWHQFAEVGYCGPVKRLDKNGSMVLEKDWLPEEGLYYGDYNEGNPYIIRDDFTPSVTDSIFDQNYNALLVIRSTELEGYTKITIKYNNIERMVTVHNSRDYGFNMVGIVDEKTREVKKASVVRGKPKDVVTVKYEVLTKETTITHGNPEYDEENDVWHNYNGFECGENGKVTLNYLNKIIEIEDIDFVNKEIRFRLLKCGFAVLRFRNEKYDDKSKQLEIPVYIYYDRMNLEWKYSPTTDQKSRMDGLANAIYISGSDTLNITLDREQDPNYAYSIKGFPGDNLVFTGIKFNGQNITSALPSYDSIGTTNAVDIRNPENNDIRLLYAGYYQRPVSGSGGYVGFGIKGTQPPVFGDILDKVVYLGVLEINYEYSNGGTKRTAFSKKFLIYHETWK